jgi:hypothetical protein
MIGHTAGLGECLYGAKLFTCYTHVYVKVAHVWVVPSVEAMLSIGRWLGSMHYMYVYMGICICGVRRF